MTYNEAIKLFDNSRRKMAETLGLSVQAIQHHSKTPDRELPAVRTFQIKTLLKDKLPQVTMSARGEVVKAD